VDIVGRDYVAEAGSIVSLCGKGKYGNIYKVNGIVIIDKTFSTKNVGIDSFLDIASRGYKDSKLKQMNLFLNNFNEAVGAVILKERNSTRITFWRAGYDYYYIKFGDLVYLGVNIDRYLYKYSYRHSYNMRSYYIVGRSREYKNEFVVIDPVFSVICDNKLIVKLRLSVMRIEMQGSYLDVMYYHNRAEIVSPNRSVSDHVSGNSYLSFKLNNGNACCISEYHSLFDNRKHFSVNVNEYSTTEGVFVGLNGVYTLIRGANIPKTLMLPKDCKVLVLGEDLTHKESRLKTCTSIVINPNLTSVDTGHPGMSFLKYAENVDTIYLSSKLSKANVIKIILELAKCELKDVVKFKYRAISDHDDMITLDILEKFFQYWVMRCISIKLYG